MIPCKNCGAFTDEDWGVCKNCQASEEYQRNKEREMLANIITQKLAVSLKALGTEAGVCDDIRQRQLVGISKYGTTVADNPLSLRQWLQHAYEESLDLPIYLKRSIEEIDKTPNQPNHQKKTNMTNPSTMPCKTTGCTNTSLPGRAFCDSCLLSVVPPQSEPPKPHKECPTCGTSWLLSVRKDCPQCLLKFTVDPLIRGKIAELSEKQRDTESKLAALRSLNWSETF